MYDPTIGRWISEDPIGFEAADPNLYRYVHNNPTASTDPSGLQERAGVHDLSAGQWAGVIGSGLWDGLADGGWMVVNELSGRAFPPLNRHVERRVQENGNSYWWARYFAGMGSSAAHTVIGARVMGAPGGTSAGATESTGTAAGLEATAHAAIRLADPSRLSQAEIVAARLGHMLRQADGATVFVQQAEPGRFNVVVQNANGLIITTVRHMSSDRIGRMAVNYGWRAP